MLLFILNHTHLRNISKNRFRTSLIQSTTKFSAKINGEFNNRVFLQFFHRFDTIVHHTSKKIKCVLYHKILIVQPK